MPKIKSAIKRVEVTERNRKRNVACKSAYRTAIKKVLLEVSNAKSSTEDRAKALSHAYSLIDRAVLKGKIHKNTAARYKSRLSRAVSSKEAA